MTPTIGGTLRGLVEAAADAVIGIDASGRIALVNAHAEHLFGCRRDELLGQPMQVLLAEAVRAHHEPRVGVLADPRTHPVEAGIQLAARRRDGTDFPAEFCLSALDPEEGLLLFAVFDATERMRGEEARDRLAAIVDASEDAIIAKTLDGKILTWNRGAEHLYGYRADQVIGQPVSILVPPDQEDELPRLLAAIVRGERVEHYETVRRRNDGTRVDVSLTISPTRDRDGRITGAATIARDVTERRRAEARFRALLEAAPDAILGVDACGRIVLVNAQAERLFGYRRDELVGQPVEVLVPEAVRDAHPGHRGRYLGDPKPRPMGAGMHLAARRKDGSEFPAEISLSALDTGEGLLVSAAVRDVTERKRAEARFRALLEAAPDATLVVDGGGRIALVNAQAERLFGYRRDELVGQLVEVLVPEAVRTGHPRHRGRYLADPQPRPMGAGMPLAARRKDGSEFPAEISLSALDTSEGLLVSAAVRDVSERLEAQAESERLRAEAERERDEKRLQQSRRLESLGQLAGGVAHDFNNLLGVILVSASLVADEVMTAGKMPGGERWDVVRADVHRIEQAAERASELTHQLLAFGRREVVQPRVINLNAVVSEIEQLLHRTIGEHVRLKVILAADLWPIVADPGQIEQVLVNLAINARDAMPGGGTLTIDTQNTVISDEAAATRPGVRPGRYARLRVSDSGTGMDRHVLEHAFEPFFTTKPKGEGSGLGLATVYGIISQAGGFAQIDSEVSVGTTFSALLPASEGMVTSPEPREAEPVPRAGGETILVVEDEDAMREVTRRILARNGYHVIAAANGSAAIAVADDHKATIDLLLTDVVMPHMLGKEVADRLLATRPGLRVVYMSGYARPVLASQGTLEVGVTLVEKPFSEQQLLGKIREVLDAPVERQ
ncbi:MAG TPA: PAS domain S-box protein [Acidimicrobiales bacterium]|nr:PAS domain S-box protein [Acidimicrobiales bacterium]